MGQNIKSRKRPSVQPSV